jgi:hypothetical protein
VYYSPTVSLAGKDRLQAFTSIGLVKDDRIYQIDMGGGFHPFRRDVNYVDANEASIVSLLDTLELSRGEQNWGYPFRLGLVEITACDFALIAAAMGSSAAPRRTAGSHRLRPSYRLTGKRRLDHDHAGD